MFYINLALAERCESFLRFAVVSKRTKKYPERRKYTKLVYKMELISEKRVLSQIRKMRTKWKIEGGDCQERDKEHAQI